MQICLKELCPKAFGSFRMLTCSPWRYGLVQGPCAAYFSESRARYPCLRAAQSEDGGAMHKTARSTTSAIASARR